MKTLTLLLSFLSALLLSQRADAFVDWRTTTVPAQLPSNHLIQAKHASAAGQNGKIYSAFVARHNDVDKLYLVTKDLYDNPLPGPVQPPTAVEIASADKISSIQIRHNHLTGETHLAYAKSGDYELNGQTIYSESISFATYHGPRALVNITTESVQIKNSIFNNGPMELSLDLHNHDTFGIAYYSPNQILGGTLSYAQRDDDGNWVSEIIEQNSTAGTGCDLSLCRKIGSTIATVVYEDLAAKRIWVATRTKPGTWTKSGLVTVFGNRSLNDPVVKTVRELDGQNLVISSYIAYVYDDLTERKLTLFRSLNNSFTTIDTVAKGLPVSESFTAPDLVVTGEKIVLTYTKHTGITSTPWVAVKNSTGPDFHLEKLPNLHNSGNSLNAPTSVSLDNNSYPIISWGNHSGQSPRASFCPDFTDEDNDGMPYREELAFRMDPTTRDIHLAPKGIFQEVDDSGKPHFGLHFPIFTEGIISPDQSVVIAGPFRYEYGNPLTHRNSAFPDHTVIQPPGPRSPSIFVSFGESFFDPAVKKDFLHVWVTRR